MFDHGKLQAPYRPKLQGFTRKRPGGFQPLKRLAPQLPFKPKLSNLPTGTNKVLTTATLYKARPRPTFTSSATPTFSSRPTPTFTSKPTPTFTSYNQPKHKKQRLSRPTVRPTRSLNKLSSISMSSPRHTPETPDSGFVSPDPTTIPKTRHSHSTRKKRKFSDGDDEYQPDLKKRRVRNRPKTIKLPPAQVQEPNYAWRDKSLIRIPDIMEVTPDDWPEDDESFDETLSDITNEAYYVRHYRAEMREKIFYARHQKIRNAPSMKDSTDKKLRVAGGPRGPWQVKLPNNVARVPIHIPEDITRQPVYNYVQKAEWEQPVRLIRRVDTFQDESLPRTRSQTFGGKDTSGWIV